MLLEVLIAILILAPRGAERDRSSGCGDSQYDCSQVSGGCHFIASQRVGSMWVNPEALGTFVENDTDLGTASRRQAHDGGQWNAGDGYGDMAGPGRDREEQRRGRCVRQRVGGDMAKKRVQRGFTLVGCLSV